MADEIKLDDLMARQKAMSDLAATLAEEKDPDRIAQVAAQLQGMGQELQAMAEQIASSVEGAAARPMTEVVLTPAQRERVKEKTGVEMTSILLSDPAGISTKTMPHTDPRIIEFYAVKEAERRKAADEAEAQMRAQLEESLRAIEEQSTPAVQEQLEQLKADPNFLGGMLQKK